DALAPRMSRYIRMNVPKAEERFLERHVRRHHRLNQGQSATEIDDRAESRCGWQPAPLHDVACAKCSAPNGHARPRRHAARLQHRNLDGVAGRKVEAVQPGGGPAGEGGRSRETAM